MGKNGLRFAGVVMLAGMLFLVGCGGGAQTPSPAAQEGDGVSEEGSTSSGEKVTLKVISAWPRDVNSNENLEELIAWLEENGQGKVELDWLGGPETIPSNQLGEAVGSGSVDLAWTVHAYMTSILPVMDGIKLNQLSNDELRESGAADFMNTLYEEKANAHVLGFPNPGGGHSLYTNFPVDSLDDFKGKLMRSSPVHEPLIKALGAEPILMPTTDMYDAMERGTVDGFGYITVSMRDYGLEEVTKNIIYPSFYSSDAVALMNLDVWNSLSDEVKQILAEGMAHVEEKFAEVRESEYENERVELEKAGVNIIELTGETADEYLRLANDAAWETVLKADPENGSKLREFITK